MKSKLATDPQNRFHLTCLRLHLAVGLAIAMGATRVNAATIYAWGYNGFGEVGDGTTTNRLSPTPTNGLGAGVTCIAAGGSHCLAVQNGAIWSWGGNFQGQLGNGSYPTNVSTPVAVSGLTSGVTAIAGGNAHSLAVQNGALWAWGYGSDGELGNGTTPQRQTTPVAVSALSSGVTAVAAGYSHSLALQNGAVWAWGYNLDGELGDGTRTSRSTPAVVSGLGSGVTAIAAGAYHNIALQNGAVWTWGSNTAGQIGDGGSGMFDYHTTPFLVSSLSTGVTAIAAGTSHSLAIKNGNVWAWGDDSFGQLGDGKSNTIGGVEEIDPADLNNIVAIAAGYRSSYALSSDGSLWVWGYNYYGELGLGSTTTDFLTPQHLLPPTGYVFTSIEAGMNAESAVATVALAPEPACVSLFAIGGIGLLHRRRRDPFC